ncbi:MAG: SAM-dependent methyltransferase, partial [Planctomycetes bacterium]|nr:SAM-dependent methyltransferase [Planctomycetota bacterium]
MRTTRLLTMLGVGCVTAAVLAAEIALTRVFSVTLWYHFAFLVISLALLGSGAAGVWLYLLPRPVAGARAPRALRWLALAAALALLAAF